MSKSKLQIPDFKSLKEMAEFWDTHDTEDYQWEEVKDVKFSKNLKSVYLDGTDPSKKKVIPVRLDEETLSGIKKVAKEKGIGTSTATRMLIRERLGQMKMI